MSLLPCAVPAPPAWSVDWASLHDQFDWIRAMRDCPQDAAFHAEGDVWTHVRLVCEALVSLPEWRGLAERHRTLLFAAALLHDVAKPECTRSEGGRITSRGHSQVGAIRARRLLFECGADIEEREHLCALVRYHQLPFYLIERPDSVRTALLISQSARCDLLATLAKADALGRRCANQGDLLTRIALFRELCDDHRCLDRPYDFASSVSRFEYFRSAGRDPSYAAHDGSKCEALLMSGLPGAGKDFWLDRHAPNMPRISLDSIREESGMPAAGDQGRVVQLAREQARSHLRKSQSFAWNATNLTRERRSQLIALFADYNARTRVVYVEAEYGQWLRQNHRRNRQVPGPALERMLGRWEVPAAAEAHQVDYFVNQLAVRVQPRTGEPPHP